MSLRDEIDNLLEHTDHMGDEVVILHADGYQVFGPGGAEVRKVVKSARLFLKDFNTDPSAESLEEALDDYTQLAERHRSQIKLCKEAIGYVLERAQTNRDFGYQTGPGTQAFRLMVRAEAAILGEDPEEHEAKRSKQHWPADKEPA